MKIAYVDLETTGTDVATNGIHQIAMILQTPDETVEFNWNVRPREGCVGKQEALDICGKTAEELKAYPAMSSVFFEIVDELDKRCSRFDKKDKFFFVGYNANFDNQFLRRFWDDNSDNYFGSYFFSNVIDVMTLAGLRLMDVRPTMLNFKLLTAAQALGAEIDESQAHDALYDCRLAKQMFEILTADKALEVAAA